MWATEAVGLWRVRQKGASVEVISRIAALPLWEKVALGVIALLVSIILSPFMAVLALLVLIVAIAALIFRAIRRRPLKSWGIVALVSFILIIVFSGISSALYPESRQEQASTPSEPAEEESEPVTSGSTPETTSETMPVTASEVASVPSKADERDAQEVRTYESFEEKEERKKPTDPDERLRYNLQEDLTRQSPDDRPVEDVPVSIEADQNGCRHVSASYTTLGSTWIETEMRGAYEAVYGDERTRRITCSLSLYAYGTLTDRYGQESLVHLYTTHMNRDVADRVNWDQPYMARLEELWTTAYVHPTAQAEIDRENAEQALDCLQQGGIFDFDWLECP